METIQIILAFSVLIIVALYPIARWVEERWRKFADRLGLEYVPRRIATFYPLPGHVLGLHRDRLIKLERVSGELGFYSARIIVDVMNPSDKYLSVKGKPLFYRSKGKDILVGDAELDHRFVIRCQPEYLAARIFTHANLAKQIQRVGEIDLELSGYQLRCVKGGFNMKGTRGSYFSLFDLLCDIAEIIENVDHSTKLTT
jgi:hypothetical protein